MSLLEIVLALVIITGLVGILVPMLPGSLLVGAAVLVWAIDRQDTPGWVVLAIAGGCLAAGSVIKYLVPGRRLQRSGVPTATLVTGGVLGIVGFVVVPVIGLPLGFVLGVYVFELIRTSPAEAWPATVAALKAVGLGILIELAFSVAASTAWLIGVLAT